MLLHTERSCCSPDGLQNLLEPTMWLVYTAPLWIIGLLVFLPTLLEVHMERQERIQGKGLFIVLGVVIAATVFVGTVAIKNKDEQL